MMKYTKIIAVGAICAVLPSCSLLQSVLRTPGTLLRSVGRTTGFNVKHEAPKKIEKTEAQKEEEEAEKIY